MRYWARGRVHLRLRIPCDEGHRFQAIWDRVPKEVGQRSSIYGNPFPISSATGTYPGTGAVNPYLVARSQPLVQPSQGALPMSQSLPAFGNPWLTPDQLARLRALVYPATGLPMRGT